METSLFKKLAGDYTKYNLDEIEDMELLTPAQVELLQRQLEDDTGDYSNWDLLKLCFTCKALLAKCTEEQVPEVKAGQVTARHVWEGEVWEIPDCHGIATPEGKGLCACDMLKMVGEGERARVTIEVLGKPGDVLDEVPDEEERHL